MRLWEALKERGNTPFSLDVYQNRVATREAKSLGRNLTPWKESRQSPTKTPLTFLPDWEESLRVFIKIKIHGRPLAVSEQFQMSKPKGQIKS
jgi:hypothetical protein